MSTAIKITKEDIVGAIVKALDCTKKDAETALSTVLTEVTKNLKAGKDVVFTGFGTFSVSKRA
ncbi:MAG: HU family DNA-binding protein, partial [Candidatus Gribaldobacteria bacterium]|nr:HU family DNA-binding protein [Candidatus Gribaldobacteria bacterium]